MLRWLLARQQAANVIVSSGGVNNLSPLTAIATTELYLMESNTVKSGGSLSAARLSASRQMFGDRKTAYFAGGFNAAGTAVLSSVEKYAFSTNSYSNATSLTTARARYGASSAVDFGLLACGDNAASTAYVLTTAKYIFSSESDSAGTNLTGSERGGLGGCGNKTFGLFTGGLTWTSVPQTTSSKYQYSDNSVTNGTSLGTARYNHMCSATDARSYLAGGFLTAVTLTTLKYEHSSDVISNGTNLSGSARQIGGGSGDAFKGVFTAGINSSSVCLTEVSIYTYSGDVVSAGTALSSVRAAHASLCSNQGHL
jgi:hypothetical protein